MSRRALAILLLLAGCGDDDDDLVPDAAAPAPDAAPIDAVPPPVDFVGVLIGRVTSGGAGVEGAVVKFGGRPEEAVTGANGEFTLVVEEPAVVLLELGLTAGKPGYWNAGKRVTDPAAPQELELDPVELVDNPDYPFKEPDTEDAAPYCLHCHPKQVEAWWGSKHTIAARDPMLHDLYDGTAQGFPTQGACQANGGSWRLGKALGGAGTAMKCYLGDGVLPDLNPGVCGGAGQPTCDDPTAPPELRPAAFGPCADCHAPAAAIAAPGATDLNAVSGLAFDKGVFCDFCHKVKRVTVNERPGVNGAIELLRPGPPGDFGWSEPEVMFGPYTDVFLFIMGGTPQPQLRSSDFCSGCHQWSEPGIRPEDAPFVDLGKWPGGVPLLDTYYEWTASPAAAMGMRCQVCHMPALDVESATNALEGIGPAANGTRGWPRAYGEVRSHMFAARPPPAEPGYVAAPGDPTRDSLREPLEITVEPVRDAGSVAVTVRLVNTGAGHSIPSGSPSRALLVLVEAEAAGAPLPAVGGMTVPAWVGALAEGVLGTDATLAADELTLTASGGWPKGVAAGTVVRFVRPTGTYRDYAATRWFGDPARTPAEKGVELVEPATTATVLSVSGTTATLDRALVLPDGTVFLIGTAAPSGTLAPDAELAPAALAGAPGTAFGKVLRDRDGATGVPFWRAVDIVSDDRIPAGAEAVTTHVFDASSAPGAPVTVRVTLLYRRHPYATARARGWPAADAVRAQRTLSVP